MTTQNQLIEKGRPTKYSSEMCEIILEVMANGGFIAEAAKAVGIHKATFYEYVKLHSDFSDAYKLGKTFAEAWWAKKGRDNLDNKDFQVKIWDRYMRTAFRDSWSDNFDPLEPGTLDDFKGSILEKADILDDLLKSGRINSRQYKALMEVLKIKVEITDQEDLIKVLNELKKPKLVQMIKALKKI